MRAAGLATLLTIGAANDTDVLAQGAEIEPSPAFAAKVLSAPPRDGWLTNGGNLYNHRYSPLEQINRDNVANLKAEWRASLRGSGVTPRSANQAQPLVYEDTVFIVTGQNDAFAIDLETGEVLWQYEANIDPNVARPCCGWAARGLGMGDGKIFVGQLDAKLVALDQRTGEVVWSIQAEDPQVGFSITSAPLYYDGMVITGFAGGDLGIRGRVNAYDAKSGELRWKFYTVPGWSGDNSGSTLATAARPLQPEGYCSSAATMAASRHSTRRTATSCGSFKPTVE
jgi:glucose dehydrogenase